LAAETFVIGPSGGFLDSFVPLALSAGLVGTFAEV
jgi:hypothetical protein